MRFTDTLRDANRDAWEAATGHRFARELGAGTISDDAMARYLVQDHRFLDRFLALLGAAMASADTVAARIRLARFAGAVAGEENTYFLRSFAALKVEATSRDAVPDVAPTADFKALMAEAAAFRSYASALAVLVVAEWLYLDWAQAVARPLPANFIHAEWVTLHDNPDFRAFVAFLREELDRVGPAETARCGMLFERAVALEVRFFDAAFAAEPEM